MPEILQDSTEMPPIRVTSRDLGEMVFEFWFRISVSTCQQFVNEMNRGAPLCFFVALPMVCTYPRFEPNLCTFDPLLVRLLWCCFSGRCLVEGKPY